MVIKSGSPVFVMTYVGERCALVGILSAMMYPDRKMATTPLVKTGDHSVVPMRDLEGPGRRFVKLSNVIWTNKKELKPNWKDDVEGRWLLALEMNQLSDEEWLGYAL